MSAEQNRRSGIIRRRTDGTGQPAVPVMAVIFVDPDIESARRMAQPLRDHCALAIVGTAREAMEAMRVRIPTMVVTELDLPDANGAQWIAMLHATPATHDVLLMVVTWRSAIRDKIAAFQAGADDFLVKPVEAEAFATHFSLLSRFRQVITVR